MMGQRHIILSGLLILLLGFFSTQPSLTGLVIQEPTDSSYAVNSDGLVDSADLRDVMEFASYEIYHDKADFNDDGVVDQLDVDLLAAEIA